MRSAARVIGGVGVLLLAATACVNLSGCNVAIAPSTASGLSSTAPNVVDMDAAHWQILYGAGMPSHPAPLLTGWQFDLPAAPGVVRYVEVPYRSTDDLTGKTLSITFRMVSTEPAYNANVETGESGPPSFHLFLEHLNDDLTNQYYRWWCDIGGYTLGSQDNQTVTLSCPLTYTTWSSVFGKVDQAQFGATLNQLGSVGITFGGTGGWGHGVNLLGGSAQFQLLDARIE